MKGKIKRNINKMGVFINVLMIFNMFGMLAMFYNNYQYQKINNNNMNDIRSKFAAQQSSLNNFKSTYLKSNDYINNQINEIKTIDSYEYTSLNKSLAELNNSIAVDIWDALSYTSQYNFFNQFQAYASINTKYANSNSVIYLNGEYVSYIIPGFNVSVYEAPPYNDGRIYNTFLQPDIPYAFRPSGPCNSTFIMFETNEANNVTTSINMFIAITDGYYICITPSCYNLNANYTYTLNTTLNITCLATPPQNLALLDQIERQSEDNSLAIKAIEQQNTANIIIANFQMCNILDCSPYFNVTLIQRNYTINIYFDIAINYTFSGSYSSLYSKTPFPADYPSSKCLSSVSGTISGNPTMFAITIGPAYGYTQDNYIIINRMDFNTVPANSGLSIHPFSMQCAL